MPFIPITDDNPLRLIKFQVVTAILIAANVLIFLYEMTLDEQQTWEFWVAFGLIPAVLTGEVQLSAAHAVIPAWATLITTMFLHSGYWHLGGNMLFLWIFGDNLEDATGHWRFPIFYVMCGVAAGLCEVVFQPVGQIPIVGASGAIAGVLGGYLVLHPRRQLLILVFRTIPLRLNVALVLIIWIAFQIGAGVIMGGDKDNDVAWWAHVGGFIAGMLLIIPLKRRDVPLLDGRPLSFAMFYRRHREAIDDERRDDEA